MSPNCQTSAIVLGDWNWAVQTLLNGRCVALTKALSRKRARLGDDWALVRVRRCGSKFHIEILTATLRSEFRGSALLRDFYYFYLNFSVVNLVNPVNFVNLANLEEPSVFHDSGSFTCNVLTRLNQ